jgi:hypothetical protein
MIGKLTALLMALVIANPACCCVFGCGVGNEDKPVRSCCSGEAAPGDDDSDQKEGSCSCHLKKKASSDTDFFLKAGKPKDSIPSPVVVSDGADLLPKVAEAVHFVSKWPPGHLPPPPTSRRLAQHGCYLL